MYLSSRLFSLQLLLKIPSILATMKKTTLCAFGVRVDGKLNRFLKEEVGPPHGAFFAVPPSRTPNASESATAPAKRRRCSPPSCLVSIELGALGAAPPPESAPISAPLPAEAFLPGTGSDCRPRKSVRWQQHSLGECGWPHPTECCKEARRITGETA